MGINVNSGNRQKINSNGEILVYYLENVSTHVQNFSISQSNITILTPTAGKKLEIHGISVSTDDKLTDVTLDGATTGNIFVLHTTNTTTGGSTDMHLDMAINEPLRITCGADTFVVVNYHEE